METFPTLLAICPGNSPVPGEFPAQRPVTRSFDVFLDLRLNKQLSKQTSRDRNIKGGAYLQNQNYLVTESLK